ncbi:ribosomal biogenesis factor [Tautogolabrus adspersus]
MLIVFLFPGIMGKNKQKGKKQKNVFHVANKHTKNKHKTKPVTTTLKHINAVKKEKVENLNQIFTEVQRDVTSVSKSVAPEPKKQTQVVREPPKESVNVDNAAQLFSQL